MSIYRGITLIWHNCSSFFNFSGGNRGVNYLNGEDHPFQGAKTAPGSSANNFNVHHLNYSNSSREFEYLHADFNTLNTKSSFLGEEDDYFLSLSKDRRFLTPIPVSEL